MLSCLLVYPSGIDMSIKFSAYIDISLLLPFSTSYAHSFMNLDISSSDTSLYSGNASLNCCAFTRFQLV